MDTTSIGRDAEGVVAEYMCRYGFSLADRNWRNRWCEIDLVMKKDLTVYFIEVKYRSTSNYGSGLEYVTSKKLRQMRYAAEFWMSKNEWEGAAQILVASVDSLNSIELIEVV